VWYDYFCLIQTQNSIEKATNGVKELYNSLAIQELSLLQSPVTGIYDYDDELLNIPKDYLYPYVHTTKPKLLMTEIPSLRVIMM
jgi:hypothetical protein